MNIDQSWYKKTKQAKERKAAGGVIVRKEDDQLFVVLIYDKRFPGAYELPKGGLEDHETSEMAAKREIREEIGLTDVDLICFLSREERFNISKKHWTVTDYFLFKTTQKEGYFIGTEDRFIFEWVSLDNIPALFWPEQQRLLAVQKEKIRDLVGT